jgi:predicted glycoside hydrolase/deacetylase ChbG (UPF0249 family)
MRTLIRIVVNADDFGHTDGVCRAIVELLDAGAVSTTTFMAAAPGAIERARNWRMSSYQGNVGVHLQITSGIPLSEPEEIRTLIDQTSGRFKTKDSIRFARPDEVEREWGRQIELTASLLGGLPSHLDSHHGAHRLPHLTDVYLQLAKTYGIPVRTGNPDVERGMRSAGLNGPERVIREWTGRNAGATGIRNVLESIGASSTPPRTVELVSHPGYSDEYLRSISTLNTARDQDRTALLELARSGWLAENGFKLVPYSTLSGD